MKILFDHQIFCIQQYGGISRYFYELAHQLLLITGHEVEIFSPLYINEYLSNSNKINLNGRKIPNYSWITNIIAEGLNSVISILKKRSQKDIEIFHETYFSLVSSCPASARRIITVYDMIHELFPENHSQWNRTLLAKKLSIHRADHIICISENTRNDLVRIFNIPKNKTSVVHLGGTLSKKHIQKSISPDKPFLLYVGSRIKHKNFEQLLSAFAHSPFLHSHFSLLCFGGGKFSNFENELIKKLKITPTKVVQISGNDEMLAALYNSASAFIYPSLYEGFGIPPLEAMSFDCPVVCSNTSSLPEVVGDAAEYFDPADEDNIGAAIEKIVSSKVLAADLVIKGREQIKKFSWEKCAKETLEVYEKVLLN